MSPASSKQNAPPGLVPFVDYVRVIGDPAPSTTASSRSLAEEPRAWTDDYVRLPDGRLELIVRFDERGISAHVAGPRMHVLRKQTQAARGFLSVRFKAGGAYPFFGLPLSALIDQLVPLESLWRDGAERLSASLARAQGHDARLAALEQALTQRLTVGAYEPASAPSVRRAVRLLQTAEQLPSVEALARELGTSTRQLRRAFGEVVGVGPKQYLRVVRFQRALRAARSAPAAPWSAIASEAGYFDQAHLSAEFQALAGTTPSALARRAL